MIWLALWLAFNLGWFAGCWWATRHRHPLPHLTLELGRFDVIVSEN